MGKRFKKKFRSCFCWDQPSSDADTENVSGNPKVKEEVVPAKVKTKPRKFVKEEVRIQHLEDYYQSLMKKTEALQVRLEESQQLHWEMISKYLVIDLAQTTSNVEPLPSFDTLEVEAVHAKVLVNSKEENGSPEVSESPQTGSRVSDNGVGKGHENDSVRYDEPGLLEVLPSLAPVAVPSLKLSCIRMFLVDVLEDETTAGHRRGFTDLGYLYSNVARQNASRDVHKKYAVQLLPLKALCYELVTMPVGTHNTAFLNVKIVEKPDLDLVGTFRDVKATENEYWGMNTVAVNGRTKIIQPLQDVRCVLHQEIFTTLRLPFRITLRDLMLRHQFNESHARFICINLLESLKYLHSLNGVHGHISPNNIIFTENGYPCLTGFQRFKRKSDKLRPKISLRAEYASPEEINDQPITAATDVFQTGILVYALLYGKSPFKADSYEKTKAKLLDKSFAPEFEPGTMSKDGRTFISKLLKKKPDKRFKLHECKKQLERAVKWFNVYKRDEIINQNYPSPFKEFLLDEKKDD